MRENKKTEKCLGHLEIKNKFKWSVSYNYWKHNIVICIEYMKDE